MADSFDTLATHKAGLWFDNDQDTYNYWCEKAREVIEETRDFDASMSFTWNPVHAANRLGQAMQEDVQDGAYEIHAIAGILADLITTAIAFVRWEEIARTFVDAVLEADTDDEAPAQVEAF